MVQKACAPFDLPALRDALAKAKQDAEQTIDTITVDAVISSGFDAAAKAKAESLIKTFRDYIETHKAEITALQILYSRPYKQRLTENMLKDLEAALRKEPAFGTDPVNTIWRAFEQARQLPTEDTEHTEKKSGSGSSVSSVYSVGKKSGVRRFADLVSLVRFALDQQPVLEPFSESVNARFDSWLNQKVSTSQVSGLSPQAFTAEQLAWLHLIRDHIATSLSIEPEDLELSPFNQRGGLGKAHQLFGEQLPALLNELNEVLAA